MSIENEARVGEALTEEQIIAAANLLSWLHDKYNVPLQLSEGDGTPGLGYHSMFGVKKPCPGAAIIAQRARILASAELGF